MNPESINPDMRMLEQVHLVAEILVTQSPETWERISEFRGIGNTGKGNDSIQWIELLMSDYPVGSIIRVVPLNHNKPPFIFKVPPDAIKGTAA
jgi:hypothetical protein